MRRSVYLKREIIPREIRNTDVGSEYLLRDVQCLQCKSVFPEYMTQCPQCGSEERVGLMEVNPYSRMPMESFLKACGHVFWIVGVIAFLIIIWQTDTVDRDTSMLFFYGGVFVIVSGVIMSAAYFALSELLRRMIRIQRRLRTFHETFMRLQPRKQKYIMPRSMPSTRKKSPRVTTTP